MKVSALGRIGWVQLSENGDPLVKLAALIGFEAFRPELVAALKRSGADVREPDPPASRPERSRLHWNRSMQSFPRVWKVPEMPDPAPLAEAIGVTKV